MVSTSTEVKETSDVSNGHVAQDSLVDQDETATIDSHCVRNVVRAVCYDVNIYSSDRGFEI